MKKNQAERRHPVLRTTGAGGKQRLWDLLQDRYTIGRVPRVGDTAIRMVIPGDPTISRHQCSLVRTRHGYELQNVSAHGTPLNGRLVMDRAPLRPGDEIRLGERALVVYDVLSDAERRATLAESKAEVAERVTAAREAPKRSSLPMFGAIAVLWAVAGYITFGGGQALAPTLSAPAAPYVVASVLPDDDVIVDLAPREAQAIWKRVLAQWERDKSWHRASTHLLVVEGMRLLARTGRGDLSARLASGDPMAMVVDRELRRLERQVGSDLLRAEQALAAGDAANARSFYRRLLGRLAVTQRPAPVREYVTQRLARL